ncbi:hypothetical protein RJ55_06823 [Drechmeria coniospora]|nr:hypothetical protein RJ55_06823 [Drechmeria coniospora]
MLNGLQCKSLPDIQALGVLSLYHFRCGRETKAQRVAETCLSLVTELRSNDVSGGNKQDDYSNVQATTYCGAVTLVRILPLVTGKVFDTTNLTIKDDIVLDKLSANHESHVPGSTLGSDPFAGFDSVPWSLRVVPAKMFQLTEWNTSFTVHPVVCSTTSVFSAPSDLS